MVPKRLLRGRRGAQSASHSSVLSAGTTKFPSVLSQSSGLRGFSAVCRVRTKRRSLAECVDEYLRGGTVCRTPARCEHPRHNEIVQSGYMGCGYFRNPPGWGGASCRYTGIWRQNRVAMHWRRRSAAVPHLCPASRKNLSVPSAGRSRRCR